MSSVFAVLLRTGSPSAWKFLGPSNTVMFMPWLARFVFKDKFSYGCISCHDGPWMIWSHHEAAKHGFNVNRKSLDLIQTRAVKNYAGPSRPQAHRHGPVPPDLSTNSLYSSRPCWRPGTSMRKPMHSWTGSRPTWSRSKRKTVTGSGQRYGARRPARLHDTARKRRRYLPPRSTKRRDHHVGVLALTAREHTGPLKDEVAKSPIRP